MFYYLFDYKENGQRVANLYTFTDEQKAEALQMYMPSTLRDTKTSILPAEQVKEIEGMVQDSFYEDRGRGFKLRGKVEFKAKEPVYIHGFRDEKGSYSHYYFKPKPFLSLMKEHYMMSAKIHTERNGKLVNMKYIKRDVRNAMLFHWFIYDAPNNKVIIR